MSVSLITIARGRRRQLGALLRGAASSHVAPAEVVVVDMGGAPIDVGAAPALPVRVVPHGRDEDQLPLAAARNAGALSAATDDLVFLDVDCIPAPTMLGRLSAALRATDGIVLPQVRYLDEAHTEPVSSQPPTPSELDRLERQRHLASAPHPVYDHVGAGPVPSRLFWSTAFGITRETFDRIGGFDTGYVGYGAEDTDLGVRAARHGVPIRREPRAVAYHQWHPSQDPPVQHLADIVRNARRFRTRWGWWPMEGWLRAFAERGLVEWEPDGEQLYVVIRLASRTEVGS